MSGLSWCSHRSASPHPQTRSSPVLCPVPKPVPTAIAIPALPTPRPHPAIPVLRSSGAIRWAHRLCHPTAATKSAAALLALGTPSLQSFTVALGTEGSKRAHVVDRAPRGCHRRTRTLQTFLLVSAQLKTDHVNWARSSVTKRADLTPALSVSWGQWRGQEG